MATLLVIDNYDSFTYNLVQMFMRYDLSIQVHRSDRITASQVVHEAPDYILISPGPKDPIRNARTRREIPEAISRTPTVIAIASPATSGERSPAGPYESGE